MKTPSLKHSSLASIARSIFEKRDEDDAVKRPFPPSLSQILADSETRAEKIKKESDPLEFPWKAIPTMKSGAGNCSLHPPPFQVYLDNADLADWRAGRNSSDANFRTDKMSSYMDELTNAHIGRTHMNINHGTRNKVCAYDHSKQDEKIDFPVPLLYTKHKTRDSLHNVRLMNAVGISRPLGPQPVP